MNDRENGKKIHQRNEWVSDKQFNAENGAKYEGMEKNSKEEEKGS